MTVDDREGSVYGADSEHSAGGEYGAGDEDDEGEAWDADLAEAAVVSCPYCGAEVDLLIDAGGGPTQEYIEDCEVCCRPWLVRVALRGDGGADVDVRTLDQ
jgi:hypothetical protein